MWRNTLTDVTRMGVFFDYLDGGLYNWPCDAGVTNGCREIVDIDQDGIAYEDDTDEPTLYLAYEDSIVAKVYRGLRQLKGEGNFFLVANSSGAFLDRFGPYLSGGFIEKLGGVGPNSVADWEDVITDKNDVFNSERTDKPMVFWEVNTTSDNETIIRETDEYGQTLALIVGGLGHICSTNNNDTASRGPSRPMTNWPLPGARIGDATLVENALATDWEPAGVILTQVFENYTAKCRVRTALATFPLEYIIYEGVLGVEEGFDDLKIGGDWPLGTFEGNDDPVVESATSSIDGTDVTFTITTEENSFVTYEWYNYTNPAQVDYWAVDGDETSTTHTKTIDITHRDYGGAEAAVHGDVILTRIVVGNNPVDENPITHAISPPLIVIGLVAFREFSLDDTSAPASNILIDVTSTTTVAAYDKKLIWEDGTDKPDVLYWGPPLTSTQSLSDHDTGIAKPVYDGSVGVIQLTWDSASGHDFYLLEMNPNDEGWSDVATGINSGATSYTHELLQGLVDPVRGSIEYKLSAGQTGTPNVYSSPIYLIAPIYNQAKLVHVQFYVVQDTLTNDPTSDIVDSGEETILHIATP